MVLFICMRVSIVWEIIACDIKIRIVHISLCNRLLQPSIVDELWSIHDSLDIWGVNKWTTDSSKVVVCEEAVLDDEINIDVLEVLSLAPKLGLY